MFPFRPKGIAKRMLAPFEPGTLSVPEPKKPRLVNVLEVADGISVSKLGKMLKSLGLTDKQRAIERHVAALVDINTPYGNLIEWTKLPTTDGKQHQWPFCNPCALLYILCHRYPRFASLLRNSSRDGSYRVALYTDETTPGNVLNPDITKEIQFIYWTLHELPGWMRARKSGWWVFGIMRTSEQKIVKGKLGRILRHVIRTFFKSPNHSFTLGVRLPLGRGDGAPSFLFRATLGCLIQDEKGHKNTWSVKGASGCRCCHLCKNIVKCDRAKLEGDNYAKHVSTALPHEFDPQTDAEFWAACDMLSGTPPDEVEKKEIATGINYDPDGLSFDHELREHVAISKTFFDWMHSLAASGGIF